MTAGGYRREAGRGRVVMFEWRGELRSAVELAQQAGLTRDGFMYRVHHWGLEAAMAGRPPDVHHVVTAAPRAEPARDRKVKRHGGGTTYELDCADCAMMAREVELAKTNFLRNERGEAHRRLELIKRWCDEVIDRNRRRGRMGV